MKSLIRTMIVFAVLGFAIASYTLAQGGINAEASAEIGEQPVVAAPSQSAESVPPAPPPSVEIVPPASEGRAVNEYVSVAAEPPVLPGTGRKMMYAFDRGKSSNMLVIPDTEIKAEDIAAITQDMQVMSHIFDKIFKGPRMIGGVFGEVFMDYGDFFGRGSRATQAIYIQGYGTLFLLEVDFPFSPPPKSTTKQEQPEETDSVWQQAKQEIFSPTQFTKIQPSEDKYDEEKVRELKSRLVKALKHAANIRNIKPEEWIILTVNGAAQKGSGTVMYKIHRQGTSKAISSNISGSFVGGYGAGGDGFAGGSMMTPGQEQSSQGSVMTIRAKKSDIDDYAGGKLDFEQFTEKVQIFVY
jgi:hypothetical protein